MKKKTQYKFKLLRIKEINEKTFLEGANEIAVIFCSSYPNRLKKCEYALNWLTLNFSDEGKLQFTKEHARLIKKFLDELPLQINTIYICTDRAESRGPAILAAILRYFNCRDQHIWRDYRYHPNIQIYKKLCSEFRVFMPGITIKFKQYINNRALKNKIREGRNYI